jgi:DinB superfamily
LVLADKKEIEEIIQRLAAAPARFAALLSKLEDADATTRPQVSEWSPAEVVAHARAANDILEPRIFYVLVRDNTPLIGYEDEKWLEVARYRSVPVTDLLQTMRLKRQELVHALQAVSAEDWDRTGTHEVRGPMSVLDIARQIADHEEDHLSQIERAIGKYRDR